MKQRARKNSSPPRHTVTEKNKKAKRGGICGRSGLDAFTPRPGVKSPGLRTGRERPGHPPNCNGIRSSALAGLLQRGHIDDEAVLDVAFEQALVRLVNLRNFDQLDIGGDAVIGAEIEHLLSFLNTADA
jgi:hypothetical protein